MLKVSFVVHSTIHLQKMLLGKLSVFCIRYFSKTKCKPAKKITGQCFSTQVKAACTHSANLEGETEITKIVTYPPFPLASSHIPCILLNKLMSGFSCICPVVDHKFHNTVKVAVDPGGNG